MNDGGMKNKMTLVRKEHLEKIMEETPNAIVYEYEEDDGVPAVAMSIVKPKLVSARKLFKSLRIENPEWTDDQIRYQILKIDESINSIVETHGKNFEILTSRDTSEERANFVWYMIYIQECVEAKLLTEEDAKLKCTQFLTQQFLEKQTPEGTSEVDNNDSSNNTSPSTPPTPKLSRQQRKEAKRAQEKLLKKQRAQESKKSTPATAIPNGMIDELLELLPK